MTIILWLDVFVLSVILCAFARARTALIMHALWIQTEYNVTKQSIEDAESAKSMHMYKLDQNDNEQLKQIVALQNELRDLKQDRADTQDRIEQRLQTLEDKLR